jgi:hypothetical protein
MIQVFKTNIKRKSDALGMISILKKEIPYSLVNIDLQDCDKVLRVEAKHHIVDQKEIIELVRSFNFYCEELED